MDIQKKWFEKHLREAIKINKERKPLYTQLTKGSSRKISNILILTEILTLPIAIYIDFRARKFNKAGIPIVYKDFVSMDKVPEFATNIHPVNTPPTDFHEMLIQQTKTELTKQCKSGNFEEVCKIADNTLMKINENKSYFGMLRHLLESILRIASLAPGYIKQSEELKIKSTKKLSLLMLRIHIFALSFAVDLDKLAVPIQTQGISILLQDVPKIERD